MTDIPDELESLLVTTRAPLYRTDCFYLPSRRCWVPETEIDHLESNEGNDLQHVRFVLQVSPSSVARCRACGANIEKKALRFGYPVSDSRGDFGVLTAWTHIACCRPLVRTAALEEFPEIAISEEHTLEEKTEDPVTKVEVDHELKAQTDIKCENTDETNLKNDAVKAEKQGVKNSENNLDQVLNILPSLFHEWKLLEDDQSQLLGQYALGLGEEKPKEGAHEALEEMVHRPAMERLPTPSEIVMPLLPFQEEGLAWMYRQEDSIIRGGILADEMGMGKTIQMIALLLARRNVMPLSLKVGPVDPSPAVPSLFEAPSPSDSDAATSSYLPSGYGSTLVVAPLAAVLQWKDEIARFTKAGTLKVVVYHGSCREALLQDIHLYDVVITTYATVESDYRRVINAHKVKCKYCGRMFLPEKLGFHQRYFCGPLALKTARQAQTKKKQKTATQKAMETLDIGKNENFVPTIANVYRSILREANIDPDTVTSRVPWLQSRRAPSNGEHPVLTEMKDSEDVPVGKGIKRKKPSDSENKVVKRKKGIEDPSVKVGFSLSTFVFDPPSQIDDEHLSRLIEMGIPLESAQAALTATSNDLEAAINLSIPNSQNAEDDAAVTPLETNESSEAARKIERQLKAQELRLKYNLSRTEIQKKKVSELQAILRGLNASTYGTKVELVNRITLALYPDEDDDHVISPEASDEVEEENPESPLKEVKPKSAKLKSKKSCNIDDAKIEKKKPVKKMSYKNVGAQKERSLNKPEVPLEDSPQRTRPLRKCRLIKKSIADTSVGSTVDDTEEIISSSSESYSISISRDETQEVSSMIPTDEEAPTEDETMSDEESLTEPEVILPVKKKGKKGKKDKEIIQEKGAKIKMEVTCLNPELSSGEDEVGVEMSLSPLHSIVWNRIVLDEAHRIKSRTTSTAKAICSLKSSHAKWCLTGTPLQNRVGELYSLVRFLKLDPFAYYFCQRKDCKCRSLHFRFRDNKFCVKCNHPRLSHYSHFNRKVVTPIKNFGFQYEGKEALRILKTEILDRILLRRTKLERAADVKLPSLTVIIRRDQLMPAERDFYESLYKQTRTQFDTYVEGGTLLHNYAHIFDLLSRLRQAVGHPYLIVYGNLAPPPGLTSIAEIPAPGRGNLDTCGLCQDDIEESDLAVSACKHAFHKACINDYIASAPDQTPENPLGCPTCFSLLTIELTARPKPAVDDEDESSLSGTKSPEKPSRRSGILSKIKVSDFKSSTKIEALVQELTTIANNDADSKSIVFSQYTSMLELIEWRLKRGGFTCVKLVGSLSLAARTNILYAFNTNPDLKIILISLKAGGEGLNLQIANNIFLMDPWWNPAAELQAIQRAHRIGQKKAVRAIRFICENTIEEKILHLQEKKQLVFDGTVGASDAAMAKLTAEDLRFLFQN